jgi:hypothetical protein
LGSPPPRTYTSPRNASPISGASDITSVRNVNPGPNKWSAEYVVTSFMVLAGFIGFFSLAPKDRVPPSSGRTITAAASVGMRAEARRER